MFYDIPLLSKLHDVIFNCKVIDTLVCTRLIWPKETLLELDYSAMRHVPPRLKGSASLKAWGYRLADNKIDFKDFSHYTEEMLEYCVQDVNVTNKLLLLPIIVFIGFLDIFFLPTVIPFIGLIT